MFVSAIMKKRLVFLVKFDKYLQKIQTCVFFLIIEVRREGRG
jgi:hypothetical protein